MAKGAKTSTNLYKNAKKMSPVTTKNATPKNLKAVQPPKNNRKGNK